MVLQNSPDRAALLQTNQQILSEAKGQLYNQPASFDSQYTLFAWISRSEPDHLSRIRSLSLTIVDLDLSALIGSHNERVPLWDMYAEELRKLGDAFSKLPNLLDLTILDLGTSYSFLFKDFFRRALKLLQGCVPELCSVNILDDRPTESTENDDETHTELARKEKPAGPRGTMSFNKDSLSPERDSAEFCRPFTARWHSDPSGLCKQFSSQQRRLCRKAA